MATKENTEMQAQLKIIREKEEKDRIEQMKTLKEQVEKDRAAVAADKALEKSIDHVDQHGKKVTHWDESLNLANAALKEGQQAYNDWRSAMMSLINMNTVLNKALHGFLEPKILKILEFGVYTVPKTLVKGVLYDLPKSIHNKIAGDQSEIDLPSLQHNVHFSDKNELEIDPLIRSDLVNKTDDDHNQLNELFKQGVHAWLKDNGYDQDPKNPKQFLDLEGNVLEKAGFDDLKNDPNKGLAHYLKEGSDLSFTDASGPRP